jgi:GntR family transcriptional regulator, histidine utilization repressor
MNPPAGPAPRYQQVKGFIAEQIASAILRPGDRLPSELELVRRFAVSRMTANRALNELETEGVIVRVQGVGSFVASHSFESAALEIRDIASEVQSRGQAYRCIPISAGTSREREINALMGLPPDAPHHRVRLVHFADDTPLQFEDRFVNPAFAPDFLRVDFTVTTPYQALMHLSSLQAGEHVFKAGMPTAEQARWLAISRTEACVILRRRTWARGIVASVATLISPASRYRYGGQFGKLPPGAARLPAL